ncbi:PfkB family carbohydrate kinase [Sabulicella glaciei]|uniref:PfkB family carbohydrate kinase n=1 Tax=Sabulicella glaciei TaxID=2984948 RepID=A0ABT3NX18_9PROT|nr:PfkB family carbohydrate kinase [Roseococcus sp. MDT2-1-1]MCW8086675.1 PfkB family carbohydrate kinase [Roseococcus sp. MDT2-1-1]
MAAPRVICLGSAVTDHVFRVDEVPTAPAKARAGDYRAMIGGMAANAAIAVARLGGRAALWGRLGDDPNGEAAREALEAEGVDVSALRLFPDARSPVSAVIVDRFGERVTLGWRGENLPTDPGSLPLEALAEAQALHCDPRWPEAAARALDAAGERGLSSVLDGERGETRILRDLAPRATHAVFSAPGLGNYAPGLRPAEALRRAAGEGRTILAAVTRGEKPTLWLLRGEETMREMPIFPVQATNTTGAGDVFHGALALALAEGQEPEAALRFASAAGALRARDGETPHRPALEAMLRA